MRRSAALGVAAAVLLAAGAAGADPREEGRKHVARANQLAAAGHCRSALPEYTRGHELLKDPAILFNRAECHRKLGELERAVEDYREFLAGLPSAPNRRSVEQRIVELERLIAAGRPAEAPAPAPAREAAPPAPAAAAPGPRPDLVEAEPAVRAVPAPRTDERSRGLPGWVWIGVGAIAVAAGVVGGVYAAGRARTDVPPSTLGNYRF